jgi:hypothetical protein
MNVMVTGWGDLAPGQALTTMINHVESLGHTVTSSNTFPPSLEGYDILILLGAGSANEDIPENMVDAFVNAGNGLIIMEGVTEAGDFHTSALSNLVQNATGWDLRSGANVMNADHPLAVGLDASLGFNGYSTNPTLKPQAEPVIIWNDQSVMTAAYYLGYGRVVYFNDLWIWYTGDYWRGDETNGRILMENALNFVAPVDYHGVPWITYKPMSGQVPPGEELDIEVTFGGNALPGIYHADLVFICNDMDQQITYIPFRLKVTESTTPTLAVDASQLDFGETEEVMTFLLENTGGGELNWEVSVDQEKAWIAGILPASGVDDSYVSVVVNRSFMTQENESVTLNITSNGGNASITVMVAGGPATAVRTDEAGSVAGFRLSPNYPNPFNSSTIIPFSVHEAGVVHLDVYTLTGDHVTVLLEDHLSAGEHTAVWNGRDHTGRPVPSGMYLYRLEAEGRVQTRKMLMMK